LGKANVTRKRKNKTTFNSLHTEREAQAHSHLWSKQPRQTTTYELQKGKVKLTPSDDSQTRQQLQLLLQLHTFIRGRKKR